jgi:hypothetical protein
VTAVFDPVIPLLKKLFLVKDHFSSSKPQKSARQKKQFLKIQVSDILFLNESINIPLYLFNII